MHVVWYRPSFVRSVFMHTRNIWVCSSVVCGYQIPLVKHSVTTVHIYSEQTERLRIQWHWASWELNCCGAMSGCIAKQVVPLCLSVFACVKLPPLPHPSFHPVYSSVHLSIPALCQNPLHPHCCNNKREKARHRACVKERCKYQGNRFRGTKGVKRGGQPWLLNRLLPPSSRHWGDFHLPSASVLICWQRPWQASPSIAQASRNTNASPHPTKSNRLRSDIPRQTAGWKVAAAEWVTEVWICSRMVKKVYFDSNGEKYKKSRRSRAWKIGGNIGQCQQ